MLEVQLFVLTLADGCGSARAFAVPSPLLSRFARASGFQLLDKWESACDRGIFRSSTAAVDYISQRAASTACATTVSKRASEHSITSSGAVACGPLYRSRQQSPSSNNRQASLGIPCPCRVRLGGSPFITASGEESRSLSASRSDANDQVPVTGGAPVLPKVFEAPGDAFQNDAREPYPFPLRYACSALLCALRIGCLRARRTDPLPQP